MTEIIEQISDKVPTRRKILHGFINYLLLGGVSALYVEGPSLGLNITYAIFIILFVLANIHYGLKRIHPVYTDLSRYFFWQFLIIAFLIAGVSASLKQESEEIPYLLGAATSLMLAVIFLLIFVTLWVSIFFKRWDPDKVFQISKWVMLSIVTIPIIFSINPLFRVPRMEVTYVNVKTGEKQKVSYDDLKLAWEINTKLGEILNNTQKAMSETQNLYSTDPNKAINNLYAFELRVLEGFDSLRGSAKTINSYYLSNEYSSIIDAYAYLPIAELLNLEGSLKNDEEMIEKASTYTRVYQSAMLEVYAGTMNWVSTDEVKNFEKLKPIRQGMLYMVKATQRLTEYQNLLSDFSYDKIEAPAYLSEKSMIEDSLSTLFDSLKAIWPNLNAHYQKIYQIKLSEDDNIRSSPQYNFYVCLRNLHSAWLAGDQDTYDKESRRLDVLKEENDAMAQKIMVGFSDLSGSVLKQIQK